VKRFDNFPHQKPDGDYPVVTLGVFDGLHLGHQQLLKIALERAAGRRLAVVTFDPHPRAVLGPPKRHRLLSPLAERLQLLERWPIAAVAVLRFDRELAAMQYDDFVREFLVGALHARHLVLGFNLHLGFERRGTPERVAALGEELGFEVTRVGAVEVDGEPVSSTRIRHLLDEGRVEDAWRLLGRPYDLSGPVIRGAGRGRTLGIPTANFTVPEDKLLPANGVYVVGARVGDRLLRGALNVGLVPTFGTGGGPSVEVHLLDFDGDLYGHRLQVHLLHRLRAERAFRDAGELVAQIRRDLDLARELPSWNDWSAEQ
jgi:riboflavin kinase/FMN adenylyltransferase